MGKQKEKKKNKFAVDRLLSIWVLGFGSSGISQVYTTKLAPVLQNSSLVTEKMKSSRVSEVLLPNKFLCQKMSTRSSLHPLGQYVSPTFDEWGGGNKFGGGWVLFQWRGGGLW